MSVTLKVNLITPSVNKIQQKMKKLPKQAYDVFYNQTPIRTGNAKRNTKLRGNTIEANYNYAKVLDKGRHMTNKGKRGSNLAPRGMTIPTTEFIKQKIRDILAGK